MTARDDLDRQLDAFLRDGPSELPEGSFYAVRDRTESTRQRVAIGPWRLPDMNKFVPIGLGAAAVVGVLFIGMQVLGPAAPSGAGAPSAEPSATPSPTTLGGTVEYRLDGARATTEVTATADGANVSGTAVTTISRGTHAVELKCAADYGDTWAFGGTTTETTVPGEGTGLWSAVIVRDGTPQQVGIWFSDEEWQGSDCIEWLASIDLSSIDPSNFNAVESGALVPPPDLAS